MNESDFQLSSYDYELPEERIAQYPPEERGASRLMVLDRASGRNIHSTFSHLADFLPEGALLVANNSCVVPARLFGQRPTGGKAELLLLTPPPLLRVCAVTDGDGWSHAQAEVLLRPSRNIHTGDRLTFGDCIAAEVLKKKEFGQHDVMLFWKGDLVECMNRIGRLPLPPYIKREQSVEDRARYQTIYADRDKSGSVAAHGGTAFYRRAEKGASAARLRLGGSDSACGLRHLQPRARGRHPRTSHAQRVRGNFAGNGGRRA